MDNRDITVTVESSSVSNTEPNSKRDAHKTSKRWFGLETLESAVGRMVHEILDLKGRPIREKWNVIFVISCLLAVSLDPLFLYIPLINQDLKCIGLDNKLKIAAVLFRSITDFVYIVKIIFQIYELKNSKVTDLAIRMFYILLDILAILPIPQVTIVHYFTKMRGSRSLNTRKFFNFLVIIQYVPRVLRIYLACKEIENPPEGKLGIWIKGGLNFLVYIFACHILGGLWYFFSVQRMIICWQNACRDGDGCKPSTLSCQDHHTDNNIKLLNDSCPINPSDATVFDFGLFLDALQSGLVGSTDYSQRLSNCFWWGLKNLSSLGSDLQPSTNTWENLFAALTSIIGLLLFLYLIGKVQIYMQVESETKKQVQWQIDLKNMMIAERKIRIERTKGPEVEQWLAKNCLPKRLLTEIMEKVVEVDLEQNRDVDVEKILSILPSQLRSYIEGYIQNLREKDEEIDMWLKENDLSESLKSEIMETVLVNLEQDKEVDVKNILSILPVSLEERIREDLRLVRKMKGEVDLWLLKNGIPSSKKSDVKEAVRLELNKDADTDVENFLSTVEWIQEFLPFNRLKKVKLLEMLDERVLKEMCKHLKPVEYEASTSIIQEGQPLELILSVEGTVIRNGCYLHEPVVWGEELVVWPSSTSFPAEKPRATDSLSTSMSLLFGYTKALVLTANDMESIGSTFRPQFDLLTSHWVTRLKKVPKLQYMDDEVLKAIFLHLKQDLNPLRSYVENQPVVSMHFITEGSVRFTTKQDDDSEELVRREGEVYGEELLDWVLDTSFPALTPFATHTAIYDNDNAPVVMSITAEKLKSVASKFKSHFSTFRIESQPDLLTVVGLTVLKRVPKLKTLDDEVLKAISQHLKFKQYDELVRIIEQGEPIDRMLFLLMGGELYLDGLDCSMQPAGPFFGEELIDWLASSSDATRPLSDFAVKTYSHKPRVLFLMANDLEMFKSHFS